MTARVSKAHAREARQTAIAAWIFCPIVTVTAIAHQATGASDNGGTMLLIGGLFGMVGQGFDLLRRHIEATA